MLDTLNHHTIESNRFTLFTDMAHIQRNYENSILRTNKLGKNLFSDISDVVYIDTKNYSSFINNTRYPEDFRAILYGFIRETVSNTFNTHDGISISLLRFSHSTLKITIKYKDYNNYNWNLSPNLVMSTLSSMCPSITKLSDGVIEFLIPSDSSLIYSNFETSDLLSDFELFNNYIMYLVDVFSEDLTILLEVVDNIFYYEYSKRVLVLCDKETIKIYV